MRNYPFISICNDCDDRLTEACLYCSLRDEDEDEDELLGDMINLAVKSKKGNFITNFSYLDFYPVYTDNLSMFKAGAL